MIQIHNMDQGSPDWFAVRCGLPTASMFSAILAKGEGKTRKSYLNKLAAEIIMGEPLENFSTPAMERGKMMEAEAREFYAFTNDVKLTRVGFITNGRKGCSPDSLIGKNGMLEIKTQRGDLLIETILKDEFPLEHVAQTQGNLWVAEREWVDLAVYWPKFPPFVKRAYRDEPYLKRLSEAVDVFNEDLARTAERIQRYGLEETPGLLAALNASVEMTQSAR
jgi:hypothetical protein